MLFTLLSIVGLCACFTAHFLHKKLKIRRFIRDIITLFFRKLGECPASPLDTVQNVISSRYSRSTDSRNRRHVQNLWDEYLEEMQQSPDAASEMTEKSLLLKLIKIISLVENQGYISTKESWQENLFEHYYALAEEDSRKRDGEAA